jgi:hypothetical protein
MVLVSGLSHACTPTFLARGGVGTMASAGAAAHADWVGARRSMATRSKSNGMEQHRGLEGRT